ncbi:hypothetical protein HU200_026900 [Digitaria exilis]|uniref:Uncharacterized protein n=1 Tax=Digitaria exilis TaxID=1010633 RepID=A0A835BXH4_9POAL|nr:hypothetical protein HU200_026900 [Digitaria exilis]
MPSQHPRPVAASARASGTLAAATWEPWGPGGRERTERCQSGTRLPL